MDSIWYYIASRGTSIEIADRLIDSLTERFYLLAQNPRLGRTREDLFTGVRSFPMGDYVILYRIQEEDVVILRVVRESRDIERLFGA